MEGRAVSDKTKAGVKRRGGPKRPAASGSGATATEHNVIVVHVGEGVTSLGKLRREVREMTDVLLGRAPMPIDNGVMTLMEVATAYYARASEITASLQAAENDGHILKSSKHAKFRTGELRTFRELAKAMVDLGSRRVTAARLEFEMDEPL